MNIDGKALAESILFDLKNQVSELKKKDITPTIAVIQIGDDPGSTSYIRQKQKAADAVGITVIHDHQPITLSTSNLDTLIQKYNAEDTVHGLIIQRPVPKHLNDINVLNSVSIYKDVDGFVPGTKYSVPVAIAVEEILQKILEKLGKLDQLSDWLRKQKITVIGRGDTAGKPIAEHFQKHFQITPDIISSQTQNPDEIIKESDIVISCVGKPNIVRHDNSKRGVILISVGIWRDESGKLHGDYEEDQIADLAAFYTPTPGGVGPVNVASLMKNVVKAANRQ